MFGWRLFFLCLLAQVSQIKPIPNSAPVNVRVRPIAPKTLLVEWEEPAQIRNSIAGYNLYYTTKPTTHISEWEVHTIRSKQQFTTIFPLKPFSKYAIRIETLFDDGKPGEMCSPIYIKMQRGVPSKPLNFTLLDVTSTSAKFKWDKPAFPDDDLIIKYRLHFKTGPGYKFKTINLDAGFQEYTLRGLSGLKTYDVFLTAVHRNLEGQNTEVLTLKPKPYGSGEPLEIVATALTSTAIRINWKPPKMIPGEEVSFLQYNIVVLKAPEDIVVFNETVTNNVGLTVDHLYPDTTYQVFVVILQSSRNNSSLEGVYVKTHGGVPGQVTNAAVQITETNNYNSLVANLRWDLPSEINGGDLEGYEISYKCEPNYYWNVIRIDDPSATNCTTHNGSILRGSSCTFKIAAKNRNGTGTPVTLIQSTPPGIPTGPPTNILYNFITCDSVRITWEPPLQEDRNGEITKYLLTINDLTTEIQYITETTKKFLPDLNEDTEYVLKIQSFTDVGGGPFSKPIIFRTAATNFGEAPESVRATATSESTIEVSWSKNSSTKILGYHLFFHADENAPEDLNEWRQKTVPVTGSIKLTNLGRNRLYQIRVAAVFRAGFGRLSQLVSATTDPDVVVVNLRADDVTTHSVTLKWQPPKRLRPIRYRISFGATKEYVDSLGVTQTITYETQTITLEPSVDVYHLDRLFPFTTYSVNVTATSRDENPAAQLTFTTLMAPPNPMVPVYYNGVDADDRTVSLILPRASEEFGPISHYDVAVVVFPSGERRETSGNSYVAARFLRSVPYTFQLGDGETYGGFLNGKLDSGKVYQCFVRAVVETTAGENLRTDSPLSESFSLDVNKVVSTDSTTVNIAKNN